VRGRRGGVVRRIVAGFICVKSIQKVLIAESLWCYQRPSMDGGAYEGEAGRVLKLRPLSKVGDPCR
jgi:hypothetical protein